MMLRTITSLCVVIGVTSSAYADFGFIRWGMTVSEVKVAGELKGITVYPDQGASVRKPDGLYRLLNARLDSPDLLTKVYLDFDGPDGKLQQVLLQSLNPKQCPALLAEMIGAYGKPADAQRPEWRDEAGQNQVHWEEIPGQICVVVATKLPPK